MFRVESSGVVCRADLGALGSEERLCLSGWVSAGSASLQWDTEEKAALRLGASGEQQRRLP